MGTTLLGISPEVIATSIKYMLHVTGVFAWALHVTGVFAWALHVTGVFAWALQGPMQIRL